MSGYRVTAGYVTVETAVPGGRAQVDIPRGADLPADVPDEQRETLLALGHIEPAEPERTPPPAGPPPKGGPGSGADAWAAYAHAYGVHVPDGAGRDQIRVLLADAGIPVE